jgi:hypothetical protein
MNMTTRMDSILALCAVVFGMIALPANQTAIAAETYNQPQIYIKARFIEVSKKSFVAMPQLFSNAVAGPMTGILSDSQLRAVLLALEHQGAETLAEPECVTTSGRQTQMRVTEMGVLPGPSFAPRGNSGNSTTAVAQVEKVAIGPAVDVVPSVLSDGYTINLKAMASVSEIAADGKEMIAKPVTGSQHADATLNLWDGQTLVLGPLDEVLVVWHGQTLNGSKLDPDAKENLGHVDKEFLVFITATIVDPAGNRVHSDDEMRQLQEKTKSHAPPQPQVSSPSR